MTPSPSPEAIRRARALLEGAERVLVLTGAGISAESGVPTFRGADGLWQNHRPEELATPDAFRRDPRLVWEWYGWRRERIGACRPNPGHRALARWLAERGPTATLATQNVDGLHALAAEEWGEAPPLLELHGSLFRTRCTACQREGPDRNPVDASTRESLPACGCGGLLRPAVVWFGEMLPEGVIQEAFRRAEEAQVALVVGTSALVHPAASLPLATLRSGGALVEVNPEPTPLTGSAEVVLQGPAGEILPALLAPSGDWVVGKPNG